MPCSSPSFRPPAQPSGRARLSQCAVRLFPHHDVISAAHTTEIIRRRSPGLPETPPWVACRFFCRFARPPHLVTARRARQAAAAVAGSQHGRHVALEKLRQPSRHNHAHLLPLFPGGSRWRQHHSCQFYTPPPPRRLSKLIPLPPTHKHTCCPEQQVVRAARLVPLPRIDFYFYFVRLGGRCHVASPELPSS